MSMFYVLTGVVLDCGYDRDSVVKGTKHSGRAFVLGGVITAVGGGSAATCSTFSCGMIAVYSVQVDSRSYFCCCRGSKLCNRSVSGF